MSCAPASDGTSIALRTTIGSLLVTQYSPRPGSARTDTTQQSNVPAGTRTRSSPITANRVGTTVLLPSVTDTVAAESSHVDCSGSSRSAVSSIAELTNVPAGTTP